MEPSEPASPTTMTGMCPATTSFIGEKANLPDYRRRSIPYSFPRKAKFFSSAETALIQSPNTHLTIRASR